MGQGNHVRRLPCSKRCARSCMCVDIVEVLSLCDYVYHDPTPRLPKASATAQSRLCRIGLLRGVSEELRIAIIWLLI